MGFEGTPGITVKKQADSNWIPGEIVAVSSCDSAANWAYVRPWVRVWCNWVGCGGRG